MLSPENVQKMTLMDKGKPVKRPLAAYGESFSGAAALGKQAASVFGSPANAKRVSVPVAPVNVGLALPSKGDAETGSTSGGSGRSTPSGSGPDFTAMMGLMQQMASQVATLGQKVESLESNPTGPPAMSAEELAAVFQQKYAANLAGLPGGPSGGAANLTNVPDIQEMFKAASRSNGVTTKDSVGAAMVQRTQGPTEQQIRSHIREHKITARSTAEMVTLAMAIDAFKEGRRDDGMEILTRRLVGVFYSDLRSNWNIMEALLPTSGQLLENSDLAKILLDAKRLSSAKGDPKTPNGKRNRNNNSFAASPYGRHPWDVRQGWMRQGFQGGPPQGNGQNGHGYSPYQGGFGNRGGFGGAPRGRGRGRGRF
jgi:hypothetical protein